MNKRETLDICIIGLTTLWFTAVGGFVVGCQSTGVPGSYRSTAVDPAGPKTPFTSNTETVHPEPDPSPSVVVTSAMVTSPVVTSKAVVGVTQTQPGTNAVVNVQWHRNPNRIYPRLIQGLKESDAHYHQRLDEGSHVRP